ncbi:MAG: putative zinc-binding metallopeptidase [Acidobacteria bacterium]|nr:putative zinc-binding metallopeptidase [Acidobacteriota bacterium]
MPGFEKAPAEVQEILGKPIRELGLKLEGSPLERFVQQLYRELEAKGLKKFRPLCYLTDEWGCPSGEPVIGIPFYLADPKLARLEKEMNDLEDSRQIMMYLRHEAGHAINYAYALFKTPEWKELFGPFRRPYRDQYRPVPFSRNFVRHMEGWYAQKHPDEDFAETFAVWLTPRSRWRERYKNWPAMQKLRYVDRMARKLGDADPVRAQGDTDITVEEMDATVAEFYERAMNEQPSPGDLALDTDLEDIFNVSPRKRKGVRPAAELLRENRQSLVQKLTYWSGVQRPLIRKLVESIENRVGELQLKAETAREKEYLTEITVYATALAMNYVARGKFVPEAKPGAGKKRLQVTGKNRFQVTGDREQGKGVAAAESAPKKQAESDTTNQDVKDNAGNAV